MERVLLLYYIMREKTKDDLHSQQMGGSTQLLDRSCGERVRGELATGGRPPPRRCRGFFESRKMTGWARHGKKKTCHVPPSARSKTQSVLTLASAQNMKHCQLPILVCRFRWPFTEPLKRNVGGVRAIRQRQKAQLRESKYTILGQPFCLLVLHKYVEVRA